MRTRVAVQQNAQAAQAAALVESTGRNTPRHNDPPAPPADRVVNGSREQISPPYGASNSVAYDYFGSTASTSRITCW